MGDDDDRGGHLRGRGQRRPVGPTLEARLWRHGARTVRDTRMLARGLRKHLATCVFTIKHRKSTHYIL